MNNQDVEHNYFKGIVGLNNTKRLLSFYIRNSNNGGVMPNILLSSSRGTGKTTMARMIGVATNRKVVEVNCSELHTLDDFFGVYNSYVGNERAAIFLDEAENLNEIVAGAFLTILNPTKENRTQYTHQGTEYHFDFHRVFFEFATTEAQTIHHALKDRLRVIDFDDYTIEDLRTIVKNNLEKFKVDNEILNKAASVVRSNPRHAQILSNDLLSFLNSRNKNCLTDNEWNEFYKEMGLYELGLTASEIKLMKILKKYPNSSLTRLASMMNQTTDATRKATELYPLKMGLIEIKQSTGRKLSAEGYKYMQVIGE